MSKLTPKQERFCEEYLIDLNATQAAIRAGYSKKTAKQQGTENLAKPAIAAVIEQLKAERSRRTRIDADEVMRRIDAQYRKADAEDDISNALKATQQLGQLAAVQAFKEIKEVNITGLEEKLDTARKRAEQEAKVP